MHSAGLWSTCDHQTPAHLFLLWSKQSAKEREKIKNGCIIHQNSTIQQTDYVASKKNAQQYSTLPKQTLKKLLKKTIHFASCIKMLLAENNNNQEYYIIHTSAQEWTANGSEMFKQRKGTKKLILKQHKVIMKIIIIYTKNKAPTSTDVHEKSHIYKGNCCCYVCFFWRGKQST